MERGKNITSVIADDTIRPNPASVARNSVNREFSVRPMSSGDI